MPHPSPQLPLTPPALHHLVMQHTPPFLPLPTCMLAVGLQLLHCLWQLCTDCWQPVCHSTSTSASTWLLSPHCLLSVVATLCPTKKGGVGSKITSLSMHPFYPPHPLSPIPSPPHPSLCTPTPPHSWVRVRVSQLHPTPLPTHHCSSHLSPPPLVNHHSQPPLPTPPLTIPSHPSPSTPPLIIPSHPSPSTPPPHLPGPPPHPFSPSFHICSKKWAQAS
jgi:hypothetical protein